MVLEKALSVGDSQQGNSQRLCVVVHQSLDINRDSARAFVQNRKIWLVVEQTRHGNALLLPAANY
jgi:hypothetical protein